VIYLDSSALVKLVIDESESAELERWIGAPEPGQLVSSDLARVEVARACRRGHHQAISAARDLLAGLDLLPLTFTLLGEAAEVGDPRLRTLDAVHLASALSIREDLSAFVAYDSRLSDAAAAAGLPCVAPGA